MPQLPPEPRPCGRSNFRVDLGARLGSAAELGFSEVIFPDFELEAHEPGGMPAPGRLLLRRAVTGERTLYDWWHHARLGRATRRRTVTVRLLAEDHERVVLCWAFLHAHPVCLRYAPLLANESGIAMETLEIAFERMELR